VGKTRKQGMTPRKDESFEEFQARRRIADAARRAADPQKNRDCARAWREENKARKSATDAAWREANQDRMRELRAIWKAENKERLRVHKQTRRARKRATSGVLSNDVAARLLLLQRGKCSECRATLRGFHIDHITPLARGGENCDSNVQLLCASCNWRKGANDPIEWAAKRGRLL